MKSQIVFIVKVIIASWLLSVAIKYSEQFLVIAPTNFNAILIVLTPCLLMLALLIYKYFSSQKDNEIEISEK